MFSLNRNFRIFAAMKRLGYVLMAALPLVLCLLLGGCGDNPRAVSLLTCADSLMAGRPDSALLILDSLLTDSDRLSTNFVMQCRLRRLNAINKLDTVFTTAHVVQARILADHFDDHGTSNEQMLAYYLLGRTFADAGEAPQAINAYNEAANRADTTATDCDYKTLCRVYTQMANVFYQQGLYREDLNNLDQAVDFGYLASDTLAALLAYGQKMGAYRLMLKPDSMLIVCDTVCNKLCNAGYPVVAAGMLNYPIRYLLDIGKIALAHQYLEIYEKESGYFDKNHEIASGREIYYYVKGYYYLKTCQYDSAEYFFRKELATGKDFNNQNAGSRGLALLFQQTHKPDSAAKYALYSYEMNDSVYAQKATEEVAKTKAMYDYTRYEHEAQQSKLQAVLAQLRFVITAVIAVSILTFAAILAYRYRRVQKKRKEEKLHYQRLLETYRRTEQELLELRAHQEQFSRMAVERQEALAHQQHTTQELNRLRQSEQMLTELISQKEQELERLDAELAQYRRKDELMAVASSDEESLLRVLPFYQSLLRTTDQGQSLTDSDWKPIHKFFKERLPQFHQFMSDNRHALTDYEYKMCLLVRLYLKPKNISNALGLDASYVTRVRRSMVKKLFGVDANSKEADMLVRQIDRIKAEKTVD